jgi:hypothetical protein
MSTLRTVAKWALVIALIVIPVYDAGVLLSSWYGLDQTTRDAAVQASEVGKGGERDVGYRAAADYAAQRGAEVYGYDQDQSKVYIWTRMPIGHTIVAGPVWVLYQRTVAWNWKRPIDLRAPILITSRATAGFN